MNVRLEKSHIPPHLLRYFETETCSSCYVCHTIEFLREIRRVLRKDGCVFWNCGDSYSGSGCGTNDYRTEASRSINKSDVMFTKSPPQQRLRNHPVLKPKDLCLIPFRVALAAQEDGWWVRSVIIWSKNNPMPESVKDRPSESHEYILMLTKSARYYWDMENVREKYIEPLNRWGGNDVRNSSHKYIDTYEQGEDNGGIGPIGETSMLRAGALTRPNEAGRNLRSVWSFPTQPYKDAHFATFPEALPERCIKAATPEMGCCAECGSPYERILERIIPTMPECTRAEPYSHGGKNSCLNVSNSSNYKPETKTLGWRPTCKCNTIKPPVPSIVLDPFAGSGTTLWVSKKLGRRAIGYDISEEYCKLALERNRQGGLL